MYKLSLFLLFGFLMNGSPHPSGPSCLPHCMSSVNSEKLGMVEAVFRYQIEHCYSTESRKVFFLSYKGNDPSDDLIDKFKGYQVRKRSEMANFYGDRKNQIGILVNISKIEQQTKSIFKVGGACMIGNLDGSSSTYQVVKHGKRWKVKTVRLTGVS